FQQIDRNGKNYESNDHGDDDGLGPVSPHLYLRHTRRTLKLTAHLVIRLTLVHQVSVSDEIGDVFRGILILDLAALLFRDDAHRLLSSLCFNLARLIFIKVTEHIVEDVVSRGLKESGVV